jgi:hypothetical protein
VKTKHLFAVAIAFVFLALASALWARPYTITCPYDGDSMYFDHQVGFGDQAVCWYSHRHYDTDAGGMVKHKAYVSCNED